MTPKIQAKIPRKLQFLFKPRRYKVAHGGRGGGKSWCFAQALIIMGVQRPLRVLCAREIQVSIQESVHRLLSDQIEAMGLSTFYRVNKTSIHGRNGTNFIFSGIRTDPHKIKSMEGVDVCWVEEAAKVSKESWELLIPTIRKPGSEIWVSFNPDEETDPTYQRFVVAPPEDAHVVEINWQDNPWFPAELRREMEYLYRVDPEAAGHVWGGKTRTQSDAQVLRGRYRVEPFVPGADWNGPYFGVDWGFSTDPTGAVKMWVKDRTLYFEYEAYGVGCEIVNTPALFDQIPGMREHVSRADCARPETISHMQQHGYPRMIGASKGPGSVEDGVEHLRSYEAIVIHPRCKHVADEARMWSYKTDKLTGDVLPVLVDKHNHLICDAARYGLEPLIKKRAAGAVKVVGW